jgi:hypothetical protein
MNVTQNGYGLLVVWPIWMKLRQNDYELLDDGDKLLGDIG